MKNYVQKRELLIKKVHSLVKKIYRNDWEMISGVSDLTTALQVAEPNDDFVNGMLGFIEFAKDKDRSFYKKSEINDGALLSNLIHDLGEFSRNRHEGWFSPRTARYAEYCNL